MNYSKFSSNLNKTLAGVDIRESIYIFGHTIQKTIDGTILIDNKETYCKDLSEAKRYIIQQLHTDNIQQEIIDEVYADSRMKIANIIKEEHGIKVTNNIIDQYITIASDKPFSLDPVVQQIREMNSFDSIIDGKIHYILNDESVVAISEDTIETLNNVLENKLDVVDFMKESSDNFLQIINVIIKEQ